MQTSELRSAFRALVAVAALFSITGCANDDPVSNTNNNNSSDAAPKAGTSYTYQAVTSDTLGRTVQSAETISIIQETGISYFGRTDVVKMITAGKPQYLGYSNGGDLSMVFYLSMNGVALDSSWVTYPFGSKGNGVYPNVDQDVQGVRMVSSGSITYAGSETITAAGETFATERVRIVSSMGMGPSGQPSVFGTDRVDTVWYAPRIKYIVRQSGIQHQIFGGERTTYYNVATLKAYSIK